MELHTTLRRFTWLLLATSQLWLLYRIEQLSSPMPISAVDESLFASASMQAESAVSQSSSPIERQDAAASLQRIELRLTSLERLLAERASKTASSDKPYEPNARERIDADQRLSSLLPSGVLSREDMARFHADIQSLPPEERFAMATALARAINDGRIQPGPDGL